MDPIYRALIVCTNHTDYPTKPFKTGLWLSEATHFYDELADRNLPYDIASPQGELCLLMNGVWTGVTP